MTHMTIYEALVGNPRDFPARHRIVNGLAVIGTFVTIVWTLTDAVFNRQFAWRGAVLALVASVGMLVYSRFLRRSSRLVTSAVLVAYLVIFATFWFDAGGVRGSSAFLVMLLLPGSIMVFHGWYRWFAFSAVLVVFGVLTVFEALHPGIRLYLSVSEARGFESIVIFVASVSATAALFSVAIRSLRSEMERVNDYTARILELAQTDSLTGLLHHTAIWTILEGEVSRSARASRACSIIMLDLDDFKTVNDAFGHRFGDGILCRVGRAIAQDLRGADRAGRYGGEEFLVILPDTGIDGAVQVAARMMLKLAEIQIEPRRCVECSLGVVEFSVQTVPDLVAEADRLLYEAKRAGGCRIAVQDGRMLTLSECGGVR